MKSLYLVEVVLAAGPLVWAHYPNDNHCARAVTGTRSPPDMTRRRGDRSSYMLITVTTPLA